MTQPEDEPGVTNEQPNPRQGPHVVRTMPPGAAARGGDGMDRPIDRRRWTPWRVVAFVAALLAVGYLGARLFAESGVRAYRINPDRVSIATVQSGTFEDFVPIRGSVAPARSIYLDAIEGGRVEAVLVEQGAFVNAGDELVRLSNTTLQLDVISREADVSEQVNNLRNTRLALEQRRLDLKSQLTDIDYNLVRLRRLLERRQELFDRKLISRQDLDEAADEFEYYQRRREITVESQQQDQRMREAQIAALEDTVAQLERNLLIARANLDNLTIRAPVDGQLTALDAEIGESKSRGERLGQIDDVSAYKVTALVDEYYVTRARRDQPATLQLAGAEYPLVVTKVYPEVRGGQFEMDLEFTDEVPPNLRRGQTLQIRLALGDAGEALLLRRGGFSQDTGGNWAFVLEPGGDFAQKRTIRLGRRNPDYYEVLEGLDAGDRVIVSGYTGFTEMDRIDFN